MTPSQTTMKFCPTCGKPRIEQARFCTGCGGQFKESAPMSADVVPLANDPPIRTTSAPPVGLPPRLAPNYNPIDQTKAPSFTQAVMADPSKQAATSSQPSDRRTLWAVAIGVFVLTLVFGGIKAVGDSTRGN